MAAEATVAANVKSKYAGADQPGTWKVVDSEGNVVFHIDHDNERVDIGYDGYKGYLLRARKGIQTWYIEFITNTSCTLGEWWGIVAKLAGKVGSYAFRVQNSDGQDMVTIRDDAHMEFEPVADTTKNLKAGVLHYDKATNKFRFYNGSSWEAITSA